MKLVSTVVPISNGRLAPSESSVRGHRWTMRRSVAPARAQLKWTTTEIPLDRGSPFNSTTPKHETSLLSFRPSSGRLRGQGRSLQDHHAGAAHHEDRHQDRTGMEVGAQPLWWRRVAT